MKWFKNINAVPKIMVAFSGMVLFLMLMGFLAVTQISQLNDISAQIFHRDVGGVDSMKQAEVDEADLARILVAAVLSQGNSSAIGSAEHDFASLVIDLRTSLDDAYSRSTRDNLRKQLQSSNSAIPAVERSAHDLFLLARKQDRSATAASLTSALLSCDQLRTAIHQAVVIKKANVEIFKANQGASIRQARLQFAWLFFAAVSLGIVSCFAVARSFSVPLRQAVSALNKVEQGDLTQRLLVDSKDEIGELARAMNAALNNVRDVIAQVGESSRALTSASSQLAKSADIMASGAHEQAASLEQTSASLEQITATVRQNSDNARQASQLAISSRDAAENSGEVVRNAIGAMNEINDASSKIAAIIRVIDEIAFQTNLLAVNASVEAARAREHGKGFAVVATEVRTLAQRSGAAAKEIKSLISDSRRKVEKGSNLVNRSGKTLTEIVSSVKRVTDIVGEIAAASREQTSGIEQVNTAMLQMDTVMQSNSSHTEELSATATTLAANAVHLERLISRFVVKTNDQVQTTSKGAAPQSPPAVDSSTSTSADLTGLATHLGQQVSMAALDEEFEEF